VKPISSGDISPDVLTQVSDAKNPSEPLWFAKTSAETQNGAVLGGVGRRLSVQDSKKTLEGANPRARGAHIYKRPVENRSGLCLYFAKIPYALKTARFPAAMAAHPGYPFTLERQKPPGEPERYTCICKGWRNPDVFTTLRWFGLGSPIVPVVQPSQSHMRKDATRGYGASSSVWRSLPESEMCSVLVVVANILGEPAFEVAFVNCDDVI
jgi:hypothetical protein